jgi:hypothetical protein
VAAGGNCDTRFDTETIEVDLMGGNKTEQPQLERHEKRYIHLRLTTVIIGTCICIMIGMGGVVVFIPGPLVEFVSAHPQMSLAINGIVISSGLIAIIIYFFNKELEEDNYGKI